MTGAAEGGGGRQWGMTRHRALPPPIDQRPFTVAEAHLLGVGEGRLRGRDLIRPFHGVRAAESATLLERARAYAARMPPTQHFSHWTAAALLNLPLPRADADLHVTAIAPSRTPRIRGVVGHSATSPTVSTARGLRVSSPIQTWVEMSTVLGHRALVVMGDALVRRQHPIATIEQLAEAVAHHRGQRGAVALTAAFARVRARTDSVRETLLRLAIVDFGLPEPEVNIKILNAEGRFLAWADLGYPQYRVIAEYDGEQHRTDEKQFYRDVDRLDDLAEERWRVVRFNRSHVTIERLHRLRRALVAAGWRP